MSHIDNGFRSLSLKHFPEADDVNPLLVWEAADEYLLQQLDNTEISGSMLILNDTFDALGYTLAEHTPYDIGDFYFSELTTRESLRHNDIVESSVKFLNNIVDYPQALDVVLIRLLKTMVLLEQQLCALREVIMPETRAIVGAKTHNVHTLTLELFEKVLGLTTTTLAWREVRLINCTFSKPELATASRALNRKLESTGWTTHNHANVLPRIGLNIGARFFIEHLPENLEGETVDLDYGSSVISMTLPTKNPEASVIFVDGSSVAVALSHLNMESNIPEALDRCEFVINNMLPGVESSRPNAMLCSPPFYQKHALTGNIIWETFHHARRCLKISNEPYTVANCYLNYFHKLKKIFDSYVTIVTSNKFVVLKVAKIGRRR